MSYSNSKMHWANLQKLENKSYECGFCDNKVSSNLGLPLIKVIDLGVELKEQLGGLYLCPNCSKFTEFTSINDKDQFPLPKYGRSVSNLPPSLERIYNEARNCISIKSYTACAMVCRKALMNVAVSEGAEEGKNFVYYIDFLQEKGYLPPKGRIWVDRIRRKGNEANHEIREICLEDAKELIELLEMLLKFIYTYSTS